MKIKHAIFLAALFVAFGLEAKEGQPNVLILIADQWREQAFGYTGNPDVKTPNIDRLAGESVDFKNAVAGVPVCCPTRASLFTGQYATTHGVFLNDVPLAPDAKSLAKAMKGAGYDTGYVGKWHLNGDGRSAFIPKERRQGFDYWKVLECTHDYNNSFYYGDTPEKLKWEGYDAIAQTRDVQKYLQARSTNDAPFLFVLAWGPPHNPYESAPAKYKAMYDPAKLTLRGNVPAESAVRPGRRVCGFFLELSKLSILIEKFVIDALGMRGDRLLAALGDSEMAPPRAFEQSGLVQVGFRPVNPIAEQGLFAGGQKLGSVIRS